MYDFQTSRSHSLHTDYREVEEGRSLIQPHADLPQYSSTLPKLRRWCTVQEAKNRVAQLTAEKDTLLKEVAEAKATAVQLEYEHRLIGLALETSKQQKRVAEQEMRDVSSRSQAEAVQLQHQLHEAQKKLTDVSSRASVR